MQNSPSELINILTLQHGKPTRLRFYNHSVVFDDMGSVVKELLVYVYMQTDTGEIDLGPITFDRGEQAYTENFMRWGGDTYYTTNYEGGWNFVRIIDTPPLVHAAMSMLLGCEDDRD